MTSKQLNQKMDENLYGRTEPALRPDLWYIHGKPYGLLPWLDRHPGGRYLLEISRGKDCTELFEMYHAPSLINSAIMRKLGSFAVCHDHVTETRHDWSDTPVYDDLRAVVREYRMHNGIKATDGGMQVVAWYLFWGFIHYMSLFWWVTGQGGWQTGALLGLSIWYWSTDIMHQGTHYALVYERAWSEWIGWVGGWLFMLPSGWIRQHVMGHHVHTNVPSKDPDVHHWDRFWNVHPENDPICKFGVKTIFQVLAAPFFTQWKPQFVNNLRLIRSGKFKGTATEAIWASSEWGSAALLWVSLVSLVVHISYYYGLTHAARPFLVVSLIYYLFSQVSHISTNCFPAKQPREWAVAQIMACQGDYAYTSQIWNLLSVGLNNQMVHHLFPSVHQCHYPALSELFNPVFAKHGLPTSAWNKPYWKSLRDHIEHLLLVNKIIDRDPQKHDN